MPNRFFSDLQKLFATRAVVQFGNKRYQKKRYLIGNKCFWSFYIWNKHYNNDQAQSHFAKLHITKKFWSYCLQRSSAQTISDMDVKVRQGAILEIFGLIHHENRLWSKLDNFVSLILNLVHRIVQILVPGVLLHV